LVATFLMAFRKNLETSKVASSRCKVVADGPFAAGGSVYAIKGTCKTYRKTATLFLEIYGADTPKS